MWRRVVVGIVVLLAAVGAWRYIEGEDSEDRRTGTYLPSQDTVRATLDGLAEVDPTFADAVNFQVLGSALCRALQDDRDPAELRELVRGQDVRPRQLGDPAIDRIVGVYRERYCPTLRLPY